MKTDKPLVSILMNCYNGEKYIAEALDSILAQRYKKYEIIFIDNCSTDNSKNIANNYPINYFKTEKNIPLGEARNFGLKHCQGEYVAFLDTDDIWLPNTIDTLLTAVCSGDYALAYAGQIDINNQGKEIKRYLPKAKQGNFFQDLLYQFDIPIVCSLISLKHINDRGFSFDANIHASEEYCLFMQLAVTTEFISLNQALVKYRVHSDSLTGKTIDKWAEERRYTLNKIIQVNKNISIKYKKAFEEAYARAAYYEFQFHINKNSYSEARLAIKKHVLVNWKYFIVYLLTWLPKSFWLYLQNIKYNRGML